MNYGNIYCYKLFSDHAGVKKKPKNPKNKKHRPHFSYIIFLEFLKIRNCAAEKAAASLGFFLFVLLPRHDRNVSPP